MKSRHFFFLVSALFAAVSFAPAQIDTSAVPQRIRGEDAPSSLLREILSDSIAAVGVQRPGIAVVDSFLSIEQLPLLPGWTVNRLTAAEIGRLPFRGMQNYLAIVPGVVEINGNLHFRGSRAGEGGYLLDGIPVLNPFFNSNGVPLIPEAIEEIEVHTGAYGPGLGSSNGGIVSTRMKTGGETLQSSLDYQTDDFARPGNSFWNTSAFGYRNIVGSAGGPIPILFPEMRFFVAGQHHFMRSRKPMFLEPFGYDLRTDNLGNRPSGLPLPGRVEFKRNHVGGDWIESTALQGNAALNLAGIDLKALGSYSHEENPEGGQWPLVLENYFRQRRNMLNKVTTKFGAFQASTSLGQDVEARVSISFQDRFQRTYDPDFKHNWLLYTDSLENANQGYRDFVSRYEGPNDYTTIFQFRFFAPSSPNNYYSKNRQNSFILTADASARLTPFWKIEVGGSLQRWTIRSYEVSNIRTFNKYMDTNSDGVWDRTFFTNAEKRVRSIRVGSINNYGYDMFGNEVQNGVDTPRKATFESIYLSNSLEDRNIRLVLGGRYEVFRSGNLVPPEYINPSPYFDTNIEALKEDALSPQEALNYFLPRINVVYERDDLNLYVAYGRYAQHISLNNLYMNDVTLSRLLNPLRRVSFYLGGSMSTFLAKPERSTLYEAGLQKQVSRGISFSLRFYQKALKDQLQLGYLYDEAGTPVIVGLRNDGEGIAKGVECELNVIRRNRISLKFLYSYSAAKGRFSDAKSDWRHVADDPSLSPMLPHDLPFLTYDQTHRGSILTRLEFVEDDGPILDGLSFDLFFSFNSGRRYTKTQEPAYLGSSTPWMIGVRPLEDPRGQVPLEPDNSSESPWYLNVDLQVSKRLSLGFASATFYANILNLFDRKNILAVYPTTGSSTDDGWLQQPAAENYKTVPLYEEFYRMVNLQNRWAYMSAAGNDIYGMPRQIRFGIKMEM